MAPFGVRAQETAPAIDVRSELKSYFDNYSRAKAKINRAKFAGYDINTDSMTLKINVNGGFSEQFFTPAIVDSIYKDIRAILPDEYKAFKISVSTEGHLIEELVPNFYRKYKKEQDQTRILQKEYTGKPWVSNASRPYKATKGLEGKHLSLWQSHGRYWKASVNGWSWQRPYLFCTNEDLFSQTFVVPYIIPMLQNAGAVVFTPRERDWQKNEVIVDNDTQRDGMYIESYRSKSPKVKWTTAKSAGFANYKQIYEPCDTPFLDGTSRYISSTTGKADAFVQWVPEIPEAGRYAVYVNYHTYGNSVNDARYKVHHKGGVTEFHVNQKMGGGTWVYLGTFDFNEGANENGMVTLSNLSSMKGIVSADGVRFGGGMGNVVPPTNDKSIPLSGMPRWAEAAKYATFWYGFPYDVHTGGFGSNEYNNDINCRSKAINYLSGGSMFNPEETGLKVPLEANIAFHTDAGFSKDDQFVGSLSIYRTAFNNGLTGAGLDRYVSRDLASMLLTNLDRDLQKYGWQVRQLWNRNYGEAREPQSPACILEMLSHQNFADMRLGYDPHFKFDYCRSVYKTIVKFIATEHKSTYVIQPLPVNSFSVTLNESKNTAELTWAETHDPLEPTAGALQYVVYTRVGNGSFDNGTVVKGHTHSVKMAPDVTYSFRVTALNLGGESFPSETLSAGISSKNDGTVLIVNGFTRLEGPQVINTDSLAGFDLDTDPGVQYGAFAGFAGRQTCFTRKTAGIESKNGLGYCGNELEGKVVMGNTFDYPSVHGAAILSTHNHSFTSTSEEALQKGLLDINKYKYVDVIYGVQKEFNKKTTTLLSNYHKKGGNLLISGANIEPLLKEMKDVKASVSGKIDDKKVSNITGNNASFNIFREMNEQSYCVPSPSQLTPKDGAFTMLQYSNGASAGIAYATPLKGASQQAANKKAPKKQKQTTQKQIENNTVILGFPLESITDKTMMNKLMRGIIKYLDK